MSCETLHKHLCLEGANLEWLLALTCARPDESNNPSCNDGRCIASVFSEAYGLCQCKSCCAREKKGATVLFSVLVLVY